MTQYTRRLFIETISAGLGAAVSHPSFAARNDADQPPARKLNVALCGLGRYANVLRSGFAESRYCRLAGIVTGTPAKAAQWQQDYKLADRNVYSYQTFDQLKNNPDIDLVYITLPNGMHKEYTIRAAQAGKHVIVEKPMAFTVRDCQDMIDACQKAGVQLAVGYRLHYEPHHSELMRLGQQNIFGPVRLIDASLGYQLAGTPPNDWHLKKSLAGGGPLMNLGVYCVQSGRYVLGEEPLSVTAQYGPVTMPSLFKEVEENITWQLTFPGGAVCTSATTSNCNIDRFYAAADNGFFELNPALSYGPFKGRSSQGPFNFPVVNQQAALLDDIGRHILEKKPLPSHIAGIEGLKDMRVIEGIYRAADTGSKIILPQG
ncbi:Gfo/Idh/MocA family protein [Spirosoma rhododendri]|uniref:Gfo/Idh/MocA family oxidoreductase n=1 Tax=Spirosoma rhododendri TaxID=2728024 RepID=A0A7L5DXY4_9BACT|nr:Gfo/Idh/MocA family oxidoreductase [Spirosoma rhododendri]QJD80390.1 Gfo/Idh/MocA family oxidoreductase [Spirosoma rhododendri]